MKLLIDNFFIEILFFILKYCLLLTLLTNFLASKTTKKFTRKFVSKVINRQYFHRNTGLKTSFVAFLLLNKFQLIGIKKYVHDNVMAQHQKCNNKSCSETLR